MKITILLITVLFVVIVKGQLYEFINGCNEPDGFDAKALSDYINGTKFEYNFYENYNSLSFDLIRPPLPNKAGFFIIAAALYDNFQNIKSPSSLEFNTLLSKSVIHITFSKYTFQNYNGWIYFNNDYYYNYYGTILEIEYLSCESYEVLKRIHFSLIVGSPLSSVDAYKLTVKYYDD